MYPGGGSLQYLYIPMLSVLMTVAHIRNPGIYFLKPSSLDYWFSRCAKLIETRMGSSRKEPRHRLASTMHTWLSSMLPDEPSRRRSKRVNISDVHTAINTNSKESQKHNSYSLLNLPHSYNRYFQVQHWFCRMNRAASDSISSSRSGWARSLTILAHCILYRR